MIGSSLGLRLAPYLIGAAVMFFGGGQIIGGYKVNQAKKRCAESHQQIIENAVQAAQEVQDAYETQNKKARLAQRRVEALEKELAKAANRINAKTEKKRERLAVATEKLATCLIDDEAREILNEWTAELLSDG